MSPPPASADAPPAATHPRILNSTTLALAAILAALAAAASAAAHPPEAGMATAARAVLASLTPEQREKIALPFASDGRRDWHYIPRARAGLPLKEMTPEQRLLTSALLASALSHRGHGQVINIMSLEPILAEQENNPRRRDLELYYLSIFGTPGENPWGWRFEGHHLSLNFTFPAADAVAAMPQFFGSHPAEVRTGPRAGFRALSDENALGFELVRSLDESQRARALLTPVAPREIVNIPGRKDSKPEGVAWADLHPPQRELLRRIVREFLDRNRPEIADAEWRRIEAAGLERLHFAWAGGFEPGIGHYYRVQGGSFVLEFDNVQNNANHIHSVWRDFDREFGEDLLEQHYREAHAAPADGAHRALLTPGATPSGP